MENHFVRFGLSPSPWIDSEQLQELFIQCSALEHPDKAAPTKKAEAERQFQQLIEAYNVLRSTRSCLLHFLELAGLPKQRHAQAVPPIALKFFTRVAAVTKESDALIKAKANAVSPMLKVQFMEQGLERLDLMQNLQSELRANVISIEERLQAIAATISHPVQPLVVDELCEMAATLGFLERWQIQLQERIAALTF